MANDAANTPSRRDVLKKAGHVAVASAFAEMAIPQVHAAENNTIQLALVGAGGRGTGAVENALKTKSGPTRLVAIADLFPSQIAAAHRSLEAAFPEQMQVPPDRRFLGFDAYQRAIDCLRPGDIVILATPPAFRWVHFLYAIQKGVNVFMEKPIAVDGPTTRRMLKLADAADARGIKVAVGLMCRHCVVRKQLFDRIKSGQIGDLTLLQGYRMTGPAAKEFSLPTPHGMSELLYQIKRFHSFIWASGGCFSDFFIHNIDECCWMKDAWPIKAQASGGREYRGKFIDQNFDVYSVEYTFPDGAKLMFNGRNILGCHQQFASYAHGTKGSAIISTAAHTPAKCRLYKGHNFTRDNLIWHFPHEEPNPYQVEWDDYMEAIRGDKPYNEVRRGAQASLVTAMGRKAAHTGQIVTLDEMLNDTHEFAPDVDKLTMDAAAPVQADEEGKYPQPQPGKLRKEY